MSMTKIVELLPLPFLLCDKRLTITKANDAFCRFFHLGSNNLEGKNLSMVFGTPAESINSNFLAKRNPKTLEGNFRRIGKKVFYVFTRTLSFAGHSQILFLFQDVTEDKDLEQKIINSRQELLTIFDEMDDLIVMIDKDFKIRRVNNTLLKIYDTKSYQEFIGEFCYWKLHGRQTICPGCTASQTFTTSLKTTRMGLLETRPNAENYGYQINCYPAKDGSGNVTGVAEFYHDLTEIMRIKEELVEAERGRITAALAAGIAHEVRNPLAIIQSNAQYCFSTNDNNEDLQESITAILSGAEAANRVIQGLLDFAKPQQIHFELRPLKPILEEALSLIRGRAKQQQVRFETEISKKLHHCVLDQKRLLQAIVNYFLNALDAMPEGGTLKVSAHSHRKAQTVEVFIEDTGKGVPEELIPKLFQPFYSTKKGGMGLGFSIAEGIIRSHGGKVFFKSWEGKGSRVEFSLPYSGSQQVIPEA
ncbi:MAG: PAS domain-containing protein [Gammaproteobacteria bacterium]|nr:PAS domain-containing protein [Gammaproteobacteria bacterium]